MSWLAIQTLFRREVVRFIRQPSRIASALGSPLIFWLLIGSGLTSSFQLPGGPAEMTFLEYFFPGTLVLLVLFASIFANISVIEDRASGFMQAVLVAPIGRSGLVLGKVLGAATLSWVQGALFLVLAPLAGIALDLKAVLLALTIIALCALGLTAGGFAMAWKVNSTQGFHGVMNLLLIPMWMLSGAFFPLDGAPGWLAILTKINPLTYGVTALRRVLYPIDTVFGGLPAMGTSVAVLIAGTAAAVVAAMMVVEGDR
jgi:ABC-2 type transport system permease protein